jgi:hypothetical protein
MLGSYELHRTVFHSDRGKFLRYGHLLLMLIVLVGKPCDAHVRQDRAAYVRGQLFSANTKPRHLCASFCATTNQNYQLELL